MMLEVKELKKTGPKPDKLEEQREEANIMDKDRIQKEKDKGSWGGTGNCPGNKGHAFVSVNSWNRLGEWTDPPSTSITWVSSSIIAQSLWL